MSFVRNLNELHSVRNSADIKERVKKVLIPIYPDALPRDISFISYTDLPDEERLITSISVDVVRERKPRGKMSIRMLRETYVTIVNLIVEGLADDVNEHVKLSFRKDAILYNLIFPKYVKLFKDVSLRKRLLDVFPAYYNEEVITSTNDIDKVSLFIVEDLDAEGYVTFEPGKEFDSEHTILILRKLAYFHAVGIALLRKDPKVFEADLTEVNKSLEDYHRKLESDSIEKIYKLLRDNKKLNQYVDKFDSIIKESIPVDSNSPYTTLIHNNMWKHNTLLKYRLRKGYPTIPRFIKYRNFQFCTQGSSVLDLVQLIFTSSIWTIKNCFQTASYTYFDYLTKYLRYIRCDDSIRQEFTKDNFKKELDRFARFKLRSIIASVLIDSSGLDNENVVNNVCDVFYWFDKYGWL